MNTFVTPPKIVLSKNNPTFSDAFLHRVAAAYVHSSDRFGGSLDSMWEGFAEKKKNVHDALVSGDLPQIRSLLQNPASHHLFYGFDILFPESTNACMAQSESDRERSERALALDIVKVAECIGVRRVRDPKKPTEYAPTTDVDLDQLLVQIGDHLGVEIEFPAPFANEYGLATERGIASYRSINALYQAYLLKQLMPTFGRKVIEIGGGSGRTAYFASLMGAKHYTIIDIPLTNVAQAIFLGAMLGEDAVLLAGENKAGQAVSILSSGDIENYSGIVLNVDSMPEMSMSHIRQYIEKIREGADVFLSINHEAHEARIGELASKDSKLYRRNMYALRPGYIEEMMVYDWPYSRQPIMDEVGAAACR